MPNIFNAGIASQVASALSGMLQPATLVVMVPSLRGDITAGNRPRRVEYQTRGFISHYADNLVDGTRIQFGDRKAVILGQPLSIPPSPGDLVNLEGRDWSIVSVTRDPAGAIYSCQVR